jgi:hypothetical protein
MTLAKSAPVIVSILIILTVAYLRERSRTLAVLFGTMPINLPLTLWIIFGSSNANSTTIVAFVRSLFRAMIATMLWVLVVWLMVRAGRGLLVAVVSGYAVWGALIGLLIWRGVLAVR